MAARRTKKPTLGDLVALVRELDECDNPFSGHLTHGAYLEHRQSLLAEGDSIADALGACIDHTDEVRRREGTGLLFQLAVTPRVTRWLLRAVASVDPVTSASACNRLMDHYRASVLDVIEAHLADDGESAVEAVRALFAIAPERAVGLAPELREHPRPDVRAAVAKLAPT